MICLYVQMYTYLSVVGIFRFVLPLCYNYLYRETRKPNILLASNVYPKLDENALLGSRDIWERCRCTDSVAQETRIKLKFITKRILCGAVWQYGPDSKWYDTAIYQPRPRDIPEERRPQVA